MADMAEPHPAGVVPVFELRHRLERALEVAGLSRDDMAAELGLHRNTIGNYLSGKHVPRAVLIAWHLRTGVPLDWLEQGEHKPEDDGTDGGTRAVTLGYLRTITPGGIAKLLVAA